jgi:hypothetical protein
MQITFDTTTITDDEVRGIFALLDTVCPSAFDPGPFDAAQVEKAVEEKLSTLTSDDGNFSIDPNTCTITVSNGPIEPAVADIEQPAPHLAPDTDANGLPWDERIHSGTKALNADGTWRTKRGVDKALVAEVEAELRSTSPEALAAEDAEKYASHETAPPAPPAPPAPVETHNLGHAPEAPPAPSSSTSPFVVLMKRVTTAQGAGKLTAQRVKELLESLDRKSIMDLRTDTDALDAFAVLLDGEGV